MVHHKRIPHVRLGGRLVLFERSTLLAWLEGNAVPSDGLTYKPAQPRPRAPAPPATRRRKRAA